MLKTPDDVSKTREAQITLLFFSFLFFFFFFFFLSMQPM